MLLLLKLITFRFQQSKTTFQVKRKINLTTANLLLSKNVVSFIQMRLSKIKTDKSDAKSIYEYAKINEVPFYSVLTAIQSECL